VYDFTQEAEPGTDVRREIVPPPSERNRAILGLKSSELNLEDISSAHARITAAALTGGGRAGRRPRDDVVPGGQMTNPTTTEVKTHDRDFTLRSERLFYSPIGYIYLTVF
jgi:hypothetical protein